MRPRLAVRAVGEKRQLLNHHQAQRQPIPRRDLAGPVREQGQVAVIQLRDELLEDIDGLLDIGADEPVGAALPHRQLNQLGVKSVRTTGGSRAAAAMRTWPTLDLPAPGSPPASKLRSGSVTVTWLPSSSSPTGIGAHSEQRPAWTSGQLIGSGWPNGSRRRTTTRA